MRKVTLGIICGIAACTSLQATEYNVSKTGNDSNPGSQASPFLSINAAAAVAGAGDTCYVGEGTYRETLTPANSGTAGNPIVFTAIDGDAVIISAMELLNGWTLDDGLIYKTSVAWDLGQENFVLTDSGICNLARWPNKTNNNPFDSEAYINSGGSDASVTIDSYLDYNSGIPEINWDEGGSIYFYGTSSGWLSWRSFIKSSTSTRVTFDLNFPASLSWIATSHTPASLGEFYLQGVKGALDYDNEWYYDADMETLYIQISGGEMPADGFVQMRKRRYTIDLTDRQYIEVRNIAVIGGSIELTGASNNNILYGISSFYGNHTIGVVNNFICNSQSINVRGNNNTIEKCEVAYGTGTGIWVAGTGNTVINCNIHGFNFIGDYDAPIMVRNGDNTTVSNNTIYHGGRDCVQWFNSNSEFSYNKVYSSNLIADDCGLFYTVEQHLGNEIHHNWFYNTESRGNKYKAAGIYLDNNAEGFTVHHNIVNNTEWSSIQINLDAKDLNIYNNTLWNGSKAMDAWHDDGTSFTNVKVWNNLADNNNWESQADKQNNLTVNEPPFIDPENMDFMLASGTDPIDYGRTISGITDGYIGTAPDVGAYEYGGTNWSAGINWDPLQGPTGTGCYGLPGDPCNGAQIPTAINKEIILKPDVQLFPNPVTDKINILIPQKMIGGQVFIFKCNGELIYSKQIKSTPQNISVTAIPKGIYVLQLRTNDNIVNRRFIKVE